MSITLACPYSAPTKTITLKNPELGDANTISQKTKFDKAMDGSIYSYTKPTTNQRFSWHFTNLTLLQREELITFLLFCMGQDIKLTDFNANNYKVRCTTPTPHFVTTGRGIGKTTKLEAVTVDLQFEVVP